MQLHNLLINDKGVSLDGFMLKGLSGYSIHSNAKIGTRVSFELQVEDSVTLQTELVGNDAGCNLGDDI